MTARRRASGWQRLSAVLLTSALAHASIVIAPAVRAGDRERPEIARSAHLAARARAIADPVSIAAERREIVDQARVDRAAGRLALGEFLLRASAIDAREAGRTLDLDRARLLYGSRLRALRGAGAGALQIVPAAFADLHYYGRPGGSMGEALIEGGGSCEPLAHLIAAALHDAGLGARARLRFYGGADASGATHIAPIFAADGGEHDLLTGAPARPGGAAFSAEDLVEVYARAHDLSPPIDPAGDESGGDEGGGDDGDEGADEPAPPSATMARGYPPNRDHFPGATPLYAERAVQAPAAAAAAAKVPDINASDCAFFVRVATLDPPALAIAGPGAGAFGVELRRVPTGPQIDRVFSFVQAAEKAAAGGGAADDPADRAMSLACLTALYDRAAVDFELRGERDLARLSAERGRRAAAGGEALLAGVDLAGPAGERMLARLADTYAGRSWILLLLRGGDAVTLRLAADARHNDWGRTSLLAALLVAKSTRGAAIEIVDGLATRQKIAVLHEVFHAHDHLRPWASNYGLDDPGDTEIGRVYRVFRGVAYGLWEGARPAPEVLDGLIRGAERERVGPAWIAALIDYYGRHALALHQQRADGPVFAATLKGWLRARGFTSLELYRIDLAGVVDPG